MDTNWCLTCGRQTGNDVQGYCSKKCKALDRSSIVHPLHYHSRSHRPIFELPSVPHPRHTAAHHKSHTRRELPGRTLDSHSKRTSPNKSRFRDEELCDSQTGPTASQWTGRDHAGILVWAHSVVPGLPGHDEECPSSPSIATSSMSELDRLLKRQQPYFPLTAQNLAPPCVTVSPRHPLLNYTSTHYPSNPEDRTAPSLSLDDTSLLTPATESVITPSGPSRTYIVPSPSPKTNPLLGSIINKLCTWIVSPSRAPRAAADSNLTPPPEGDQVAVHTDGTASCCYASHYGDKSSAEAVLTLTSPTDTRVRVTPVAIGREGYEYDIVA